jgi:propionyl-CoA carboxylase alpha chain
MISKLIVHAANREQAIERMTRAIAEYKISGVQTTLEFCSWAINHEAFKSGNFDTHFVKDYFTPEILKQELTAEETEVAAIAAEILFHQNNASAVTNASSEQKTSAWKLRARD